MTVMCSLSTKALNSSVHMLLLLLRMVLLVTLVFARDTVNRTCAVPNITATGNTLLRTGVTAEACKHAQTGGSRHKQAAANTPVR